MGADLVHTFTNEERTKDFYLSHSISRIVIARIHLLPTTRFQWNSPKEWPGRMDRNGLYLKASCFKKNQNRFLEEHFDIGSYNHPSFKQPSFELQDPINIPGEMGRKVPTKDDYPIKVTIELCGIVPTFDFDVRIFYQALVF